MQEYGQDQLKVFSHEGDAVDSMDLNDVKTELEEAADMAEVGWVRWDPSSSACQHVAKACLADV